MPDPSTPPASRLPPPIPGLNAKAASVVFLGYIGGQILGGMIFGFTMGVLVVVLHGGRGGVTVESLIEEWMPLGVLFSFIAGGLIAILLTRQKAGHLIRVTGDRGIGWVRGGLRPNLFYAGLGTLLALSVLANQIWFFPAPEDTPVGPLTELAMSGVLGLSTWIFFASVAPFIEEFMFRGVMFTGFGNSWGRPAAGIVVTAIFFLLHVPETVYYWPNMVAIGLLAVLTLFARLGTGCLGPAVSAHACYNLVLVGYVLATL